MLRQLLACGAAASVALVGCSSGDDAAAPDDAPPSSEAVTATTEPDTVVESVPDGMADSVPPDASAADVVSVQVDAAGLSDDRAIARGAGGLVQQGQTFRLDEPSVLTSVSFTVVPADDVPAGQVLHLDLYGVDDPVALVPSSPIDVAPSGGGIDLVIPGELDAGAAVAVTFEVPGVELAPGDYAAVLSIPDGARAIELFVQHAVSDDYPEGVAIWFEGSTWKVARTTGDQAFALELLV